MADSDSAAPAAAAATASADKKLKCAGCSSDRKESDFSGAQLKKKGKRLCKSCVTAGTGTGAGEGQEGTTSADPDDLSVLQAAQRAALLKLQQRHEREQAAAAAAEAANDAPHTGTKARLKAKLQAATASEQPARAGPPETRAQPSRPLLPSGGASDSPAASAPAPSISQLRAVMDGALKHSTEFKLVARSYLDWYEAVAASLDSAPGMHRPAPESWTEVIRVCQLVLIRFSVLVSHLSGDTVGEEERDEYVFYRAAVMLTFTQCSLEARRIPDAIHMIQGLICLMWERFGGLGLQAPFPLDPKLPRSQHHNLFLVQPIKMLLGTMSDARLLEQAERVVIAIEDMVEQAVAVDESGASATKTTKGGDAAVEIRMPDVFRSPTMMAPTSSSTDAPSASASDSGFMLPAFMRTRLYAPSDSIRSQAASMGFRGFFGDNLILNLQSLTLRFRALHADSAQQRLRCWFNLCNVLSAAEAVDVKRPGFYSQDILLEAAEALAAQNFLSQAAGYLAVLERFHQPFRDSQALAPVSPGADLPPQALMKLEFQLAAQLTTLHSKMLAKYAVTSDVKTMQEKLDAKVAAADRTNVMGAATVTVTAGPAPPPAFPPYTPAESLSRFTAYWSLLCTRIQASGDQGMYVEALQQQVLPLAKSMNRPWEALKKTREALGILTAPAGLAATARDPALLRRVQGWHAMHGWILAECLVPPQNTAALEAYARSRECWLKWSAVMLGAGRSAASKEVPLDDWAAHIRLWLIQLETTGAPLPAAELVSQLEQIAQMEEEYKHCYLLSRNAALRKTLEGRELSAQEDVSRGTHCEGHEAVLQELLVRFDVPGARNTAEHQQAEAASAAVAAWSSSSSTAAASAVSGSAVLSSLTRTQLAYMHHEALSSVLASTLRHARSRAAAGAPPGSDAPVTRWLSALARMAQAHREYDHDRAFGAKVAMAEECLTKSTAFPLCARDGCRIRCVPPEFAFAACAACQSVAYCSRECQKQHWNTHKNGCKKKTTADATATTTSSAGSAASAAPSPKA